MNPNSTAKEQSLNPRSKLVITNRSGSQSSKVMPLTIASSRLSRLRETKKALDPVVLDLREIVSFTDFFVITSGANERTGAIADEVLERLKKNGSNVARVEGRKTAEWILLDYGDFIVHVFADKARKFYDLERLWREAKRLNLQRWLVSRAL